MVGLLVMGLPFGLVSARWPRQWTLALPLLLWGGLAGLEWLGVVHIYSGNAASMLIVGGTVFAAVGYAVGRSRKRADAAKSGPPVR